MKTKQKKKLSNKMLSWWALNLGLQPFGSDDHFSELSRHVLLGKSKILLWSCSVRSNKII